MVSQTAKPGTHQATSDDRGRQAGSPWQMPWSGWKDVLTRTWRESSDDNVGIVAAGVAFYGFLAMVPLLGAIVLSYGLVAEPRTVVGHMQGLTNVMPADAAKLIGEMLMNVVQQSSGKKGIGILVALAVALFGARNAAGSIITALNIAYEEKEKRGFIAVNLLALGMTLAAVLVALLAFGAVAVLGLLEDLIPGAPAFVIGAGKVLAYVLLVLAAAAGAATLYRYGPSRDEPQWQWITPGSLFTAVAWVLLTLGFGFYVTNFGSYDKTYGSMGAVVVLLTWMYLSSYVLLLGAEMNSELEHQTARDTTEGSEQPLGQRSAWSADHLADGAEDRPAATTQSDAPRSPQPHNGGVERASPGRELVAARATDRANRAAGLQKVGLVSSALATTGLALMRKRGRTGAGAALLATAAGLSLLKRQD